MIILQIRVIVTFLLLCIYRYSDLNLVNSNFERYEFENF